MEPRLNIHIQPSAQNHRNRDRTIQQTLWEDSLLLHINFTAAFSEKSSGWCSSKRLTKTTSLKETKSWRSPHIVRGVSE